MHSSQILGFGPVCDIHATTALSPAPLELGAASRSEAARDITDPAPYELLLSAR